jgi:hypothetical protein
VAWSVASASAAKVSIIRLICTALSTDSSNANAIAVTDVIMKAVMLVLIWN